MVQVKDLTVEQFKALIRDTLDETLEYLGGDPDEGQEIKEVVKHRLLEIKKRRNEGKRGIPAEEVYKQLKLNN